MKRMKKSMLLFVVMLTVFVSACTFSASAKNVIVPKQKQTTSLKAVKKNAPKIKHTSTTLNMASSKGYIKFTAPKKATYRFIFYDLVIPEDAQYCSAYVKVLSSKLAPKKILTEYAKKSESRLLYLATTDDKAPLKADSFLTKRTAKLKLKKGETIYMYIEFASKIKNNGSVSLKIKSK